MSSAFNKQEGGSHYSNMKIQPMEYILANNIGFAEGSVIKYVSRWKNKNGIEDLKKAIHILEMLVEKTTLDDAKKLHPIPNELKRMVGSVPSPERLKQMQDDFQKNLIAQGPAEPPPFWFGATPSSQKELIDELTKRND